MGKKKKKQDKKQNGYEGEFIDIDWIKHGTIFFASKLALDSQSDPQDWKPPKKMEIYIRVRGGVVRVSKGCWEFIELEGTPITGIMAHNYHAMGSLDGLEYLKCKRRCFNE